MLCGTHCAVDDATSELVDEYQNFDETLAVHVLPQNVGLIKALNFGLNHWQHPIIFRMDANDTSHPERIRIQFEFIATDPEVSLLGTQMPDFTGCIENLLPAKL